MKYKHPNERGAVFFYILIAIALFAALTYALNRNTGNDVSLMTGQQAKLAAQEIIEYGETVANAVQKLRLRGFQDTEIEFANTIYKTHGGDNLNDAAINNNVNCTSDECNVFSPQGGNINPIIFKTSGVKRVGTLANWGMPGHAAFRVVSVEGVGTAASDLVMEILSLSNEVCTEINKINGTLISNSSPSETYAFAANTGIYPDLSTNTMGDTSPLSGKLLFCNKYNGDSQHQHFMQVLIAR